MHYTTAHDIARGVNDRLDDQTALLREQNELLREQNERSRRQTEVLEQVIDSLSSLQRTSRMNLEASEDRTNARHRDMHSWAMMIRDAISHLR